MKLTIQKNAKIKQEIKKEKLYVLIPHIANLQKQT